MRGIAWAFGKAFLIALFLTPIVRDIFHAYNVVDRPGLRKVHAYPIPRLGGISIAVAYVIGLAGLLDDAALAWKLLPGAAVIFAIGILDDFFNLSPRYKLVGQIVAGCVAFGSGLRVPGSISLHWLPLSFLLTVGWLLVTVNAFNLVDGLDGLCGGMGLIATGTIFALPFLVRASSVPEGTHASLAIVTLPLTGALLGFLCHNFSRATVFLGDSGALLIGFLTGCCALLWTEQAPSRMSMLAPVLAMSIPLLDLSLSVVRRFIQNKPIFSADRRHMHHRLLDRGLSSRRVVVMLYFWAISGSILALLLVYAAYDRRWELLVIAGFCATTWAGIRQLRYSEFEVAARLLIRGEFRRVLRDKMRVRNLAESLHKSNSEDAWWDVLVDAGQQAGWSTMQWKSKEFVRREKVFSDRAPSASTAGWSFEIALGDGESVRVDGMLSPGQDPLDLTGFAQAMQNSFEARHRVWAQPELS